MEENRMGTELELRKKKEKLHKFLKRTNYCWNNSNCSRPQILGGLVEMLENSNCLNFEDWEQLFYKEVSKEQLNRCYFIFEDCLKKNDIEYTKQDLIDTILIHCILETWDGFVQERNVKSWLLNQDEVIDVEKTKQDIDYEIGIDFVVTLTNFKKIGVQVKPISFTISCSFMGTNIMNPLLGKMKKWKDLNENNLDIFIIFTDGENISNISKTQFWRYVEDWKNGRVKDV